MDEIFALEMAFKKKRQEKKDVILWLKCIHFKCCNLADMLHKELG